MSSHHFHAVVWIDHHEGRVFHFSPSEVDKLVLHPDHPTRHIHHKANSIGSGHAAEDHNFLQAVAASIEKNVFMSRAFLSGLFDQRFDLLEIGRGELA